MPNEEDVSISLNNLDRFLDKLEKKFIKDITEQDVADQSVLEEIYNECPQVLRVSTSTDGLQMYRLQNDHRTDDSRVAYSCLLFGALIELSLTLEHGTYVVGVVRYELTPVNNN